MGLTETELTAFTGFRLLAKKRAYTADYEVHRASTWLLRGRIGRRLMRCIRRLWDAVIYANSVYQVTLFQRVGSTGSA
jgi:hypothetical protein